MAEDKAHVTEGEGEKAPPSRNEAARSAMRQTDRIQELRERLYARGAEPQHTERHTLTRPPVAPARSFNEPATNQPRAIYDELPHPPAQSPSAALQHALRAPAPATPLPTVATIEDMTHTKRARAYRLKLILAALVFFVGALVVSSGFLFFGNNKISGENITVEITGPLAVGGGEELNLQIVVANQNTVPIEAATLIVNYPPGTQSAREPGKELFSERLQLNNVESGEVVNVPVRAIVFGEENEKKNITVEVEYRVKGSNATFSKKADPLSFQISTSPIVLSVNSVKSLSSGQEVKLELTVQSNTTAELKELLVKMTAPAGFDFSKSTPEPVGGRDTWRIDTLKPGEKKTISLTGTLVGREEDAEHFFFSIGVPNERDRYNLASTLASITYDIQVERPFIELGMTVNGDTAETVVIDPSEVANITVSFKNSLDTAIYDGVVKVVVRGNALDEVNIDVDDGHYDSETNTITWDSVGRPSLKEILPGEDGDISFTLRPRSDTGRTPELTFSASVAAKRVFDDRVPQELEGTVARTIKIASVPKIKSSVLYSEVGPFKNTGPIPPVAEQETQYTFLLAADTGTNAVSGAEVTAVLPQYVQWLGNVSEGEVVSYNAANRTVTWRIGDMDAKDHEEVWVQVAFKPSLSQVGKTPTLLETQRFKATDRFTTTIVRSEAYALTTDLSNDPDAASRDGQVRASE